MKQIKIYYGPKNWFEEKLPDKKITLTEIINEGDLKRNKLIVSTDYSIPKKEKIENLIIYSDEYAGITEGAMQNFIGILNLYDIDYIYLHNPTIQILNKLKQTFKSKIEVKKYSYKKITKKIFLNINNTFSSNIIGQEKVLEKILISLYPLMFTSNCSPIVLMFYGKSGVGKTETAKFISKILGQKLFRKQFSMFHSDEFAKYLFGGSHNQNSFAKELMERESNVILLDEFDKGNKIFYSAFYQLFDEGIFEDKNYKVDLKNSIIICTSNYKSENEIRRYLGDPIFFRFTKLIKFEDLTSDALEILVNNICNNKYSKLNDKDKVCIDIEYIRNTLISNVSKLDNVRQISNIIDEYIGEVLVKKLINEEKINK